MIILPEAALVLSGRESSLAFSIRFGSTLFNSVVLHRFWRWVHEETERETKAASNLPMP